MKLQAGAVWFVEVLLFRFFFKSHIGLFSFLPDVKRDSSPLQYPGNSEEL